MQKKIILVCLLLLLVGCKRIDSDDDYVGLVENCLTEKKISNDVASGYKYYVPRGVEKIRNYDYNQIFLVDDSYLYLYVDIISYKNKKDITLEKASDDYYYQTFKNEKILGYLKIKEEDDKYFISMGYNYAKIEVYTSYENMKKIITMSAIILNNIQYNDTVIEKILDGDIGKYSEVTYEVDKPDDASSNFSQYLEEYVQKEKQSEKLPS